MLDQAFKVSDVILKSMSSIAIIAGVVVSYFKWIDHKFGLVSASPTLDLQVSEDTHNYYILATYELQNTASQRMEIPELSSSLSLSVVPYEKDQQDRNSSEPFMSTENDYGFWEVFEDEDWIDKGETIRGQKLITLPRIKATAFRVRLRVVTYLCRRWWNSKKKEPDGTNWTVAETIFLNNYGTTLKQFDGDKNAK